MSNCFTIYELPIQTLACDMSAASVDDNHGPHVQASPHHIADQNTHIAILDIVAEESHANPANTVAPLAAVIAPASSVYTSAITIEAQQHLNATARYSFVWMNDKEDLETFAAPLGSHWPIACSPSSGVIATWPTLKSVLQLRFRIFVTELQAMLSMEQCILEMTSTSPTSQYTRHAMKNRMSSISCFHETYQSVPGTGGVEAHISKYIRLTSTHLLPPVKVDKENLLFNPQTVEIMRMVQMKTILTLVAMCRNDTLNISWLRKVYEGIDYSNKRAPLITG
ncbi:hypothetical protein DFP72DRAFT_861397 [Ephemerocybe angulata]|uniref:Uncharacterized protein n=1 Tax=Ephemerocybe angulata TaxID=980116 RepID=A0A8H6H7E4_9AGAR|nr:hypothetical protein DFP72DRAFT_861397 [Tulosesus angulatus]